MDEQEAVQAPPRPPPPHEYDDVTSSDGTDTDDDALNHVPLEDEYEEIVVGADGGGQQLGRHPPPPGPPKPPRMNRRTPSCDLAMNSAGSIVLSKRTRKPPRARKPTPEKVNAALTQNEASGKKAPKQLLVKPVPPKKPATSQNSASVGSNGVKDVGENSSQYSNRETPLSSPTHSNPVSPSFLPNHSPFRQDAMVSSVGEATPRVSTDSPHPPSNTASPATERRALLPPGFKQGPPKSPSSVKHSFSQPVISVHQFDESSFPKRLTPPITTTHSNPSTPTHVLPSSAFNHHNGEGSASSTRGGHAPSPLSSQQSSPQHTPFSSTSTPGESTKPQSTDATQKRPTPPPKKAIRWQEDSWETTSDRSATHSPSSTSSHGEDDVTARLNPRRHTEPLGRTAPPTKPPRLRANTGLDSRSPTPESDPPPLVIVRDRPRPQGPPPRPLPFPGVGSASVCPRPPAEQSVTKVR